MLELNAPARPLSELATTSRWRWSLPVPANSLGAPSPATLPARLAMTAPRRWAYGRAASAEACALRSLAAATICLALVIFWVDLTELIRPLSSVSQATLTFLLFRHSRGSGNLGKCCTASPGSPLARGRRGLRELLAERRE